MIPLPAFIDPEAWAEFVMMRKAIKKPLNERSAARALKKLYTLRDLGHDPNASLLQSADFYWQDLYEPKEDGFSKKATEPAKAANTWLQEQAAHKAKLEESEAKARNDAARIAAMSKLRPLKRVA